MGEVDIVVSGDNYGWSFKEGSFRFNPADGSVASDLSGLPAGLIEPVVQYDHTQGQAVVGGLRDTQSPPPDPQSCETVIQVVPL